MAGINSGYDFAFERKEKFQLVRVLTCLTALLTTLLP